MLLWPDAPDRPLERRGHCHCSQFLSFQSIVEEKVCGETVIVFPRGRQRTHLPALAGSTTSSRTIWGCGMLLSTWVRSSGLLSSSISPFWKHLPSQTYPAVTTCSSVCSSWQFRIKHPVVQWMLWHSCIYRHLQLDLMGYQKRDLKLGGGILEKIYGELEEENGSRYDHISLPTCGKIFKKKRLVILAPASKLLASSYGHGGNSNRSHSNQSRSCVHMYVNNIILRSQL